MSYEFSPLSLVGAREIIAVDPHQVALDRQLRRGGAVIGVLLASLFALGFVVKVDSAVIGAGEVAIESQIKKISHPDGGALAELFVRDGQSVRKGQALLRLDSRVTGTNATKSGESLEQLQAQQARLIAERDNAARISFPTDLATSTSPTARYAMSEEARLFALNRQAGSGEQTQFAERIRQTEAQIDALQAQLAAAHQASALIEPERAGMRQLYDRQLVTISRMNAIERSAVDITASAAQLRAQIAEARARVAELRQQAIAARVAASTRAGMALDDLNTRLNDQSIRTVAATDSFDRSVIRAPEDGIVDKVAYATRGGLVPPGQTILELVPTHAALSIDARIPVTDIDDVRPGQSARLRFSGFNQHVTPEIAARVAMVSPARTNDERTGAAYYLVRLTVTADQQRALGAVKLVPGMPVEVFVNRGTRSILSYLFKPLSDQFSRAFR